MLHKSYLEASREAGFFVNEELHEWGTEDEPSKLTAAAHRWRKKLNSERSVIIFNSILIQFSLSSSLSESEINMACKNYKIQLCMD